MDSCRQRKRDDTLLFSVDFPRAKPKDSFRIINDGYKFELEAEKRRRCCGDGREPSLAIAVSSHGPRDIIAILKRDGIIRGNDAKTNYQVA